MDGVVLQKKLKPFEFNLIVLPLKNFVKTRSPGDVQNDFVDLSWSKLLVRNNQNYLKLLMRSFLFDL